MKKAILVITALGSLAAMSALKIKTAIVKPAVPVEAPSQKPGIARDIHVIPKPVPQKPLMSKTDKGPAKNYRYGSPETLIKNKLEYLLGREVKYLVTLDRMSRPWRLVCGRPIELQGGAFDYKNSRLKKEFESYPVEDQFCALFKSYQGQSELVAFDLGSTDNYIAGWAEKLGLPASLTK